MRFDQLVRKLSKLKISMIPQLGNTFQKSNWFPNQKSP